MTWFSALRIANGGKLDITEDPTPRGHAIEFRINGEDAQLPPAPGPVTSSPAVRPLVCGWTPAVETGR